MARTCPIGFDTDHLVREVLATYDRVARDPGGEFHFHRGAEYAASRLGYDREELAALPDLATARFAGVGNPLAIGPLYPGETVLDHACGAGTDLLLAARRIGPTGHAIGVDMTPAMRSIALQAAQLAGLSDRIEIRAGLFQNLPVDDASIDVVISNGVVNLAPDKERVFHEIFRVLRPGGRLYLADVSVQRELSLSARSDPDLWAACVAGALPEPELSSLARDVGFEAGRITQHFDSFRQTSAAARVSSDLHVSAVNFHAQKPASVP